MIRATKILFITVLLCRTFYSPAQLLTNLGEYRNQVFVNSGYYLSFANYSAGWIHNEHIKFLKRDVAGILDFSFPYSDTSHTKFVFRKGFQTNIWANEKFRVPIAIISSSDKVVTDLLKVHNFVTDFFFNPGIYKRGYTIALDLDYKIIWFSRHKEIRAPATPAQNDNWLGHTRHKLAAGVALGLNYKRFTYLIRGGYQQRADLAGRAYAFYAVFQLGYNCNFRKRKPEVPPVKP